MDLGHTQLVSIIEDDENKSSETKGQQRSEGGAKPNYLAWSDGSHSVLSSHQHEMVLQSKERTHEILQYLTTTFPNIFPPMNQRRLSEDSGASTSVKSMITDLDTIGVAGKKIEDTMKLSHVMDLVKLFQEHVPTAIIDPFSYQEGDTVQEAGMMTDSDFNLAVKKAMGLSEGGEYDSDLYELFRKIDTRNTGYIVLMDFVMYMLQKYWEKDSMEKQLKSPFQSKPRVRICRHNHQEPTVKVVLIKNPSRYISFSKEGEFGVWDQNDLSLGKIYKIDTEQQDNNNKKMVHKVWVMDAIVLSDCGKMAVSTTGRDIRFYDISSSIIFEEFQLYGLSNVVTCFDYFCSTNFRIVTESILTTGDDGGHIFQYYFTQARNKLFEKPPRQAKGQKTRVYINDLRNHAKCVRVEELVNKDGEPFHKEGVRCIQYFADNHVIVSTSGSAQSSVVMADTICTRLPYIWKIDKGVECFDLSRKLDLMVTGSVDHFVKFWNQYVTSRPLAVLKGHNSTVVGVAIIEHLGFVVSYSEEAIIKVWHISDYKCIDTIDLNFQCLENRAPEHGGFPVSYFPSLNCYMFTCNDYMAELKVGAYHQFVMDYIVTHNSSLCGAIYNELNCHVVTACDESEVAAWNSETGSLVNRFYKAHDFEEITAISFDRKGDRLVTGGRDGTCKVWYYQSGVLSHVLLPTDDAEVTSILPVQHMGKPVIITAGWNRKIIVYNDDAETERVQVAGRQKWKGGQLHSDDILSMDICYPWMASSSFDGELLLWHSEQEILEAKLLRGGYDTKENRDQILEAGSKAANIGDTSRPITRGSRPSTRGSSKASRPSSRHRRLWAQTPIAGRLPIDKVMFIKSRATHFSTMKAILVSSEAGTLSFWHCFQKQKFASFYAASRPHSSVLAMFDVGLKGHLLTGDTRGYISLWNIQDYAMKAPQEVVTDAPPLIRKFKAHYQAIVSVQWFKHSSGTSFIVSASTDRAARLWSYGSAQLVGTFGQPHKWDLRDQSTWNQEGLDLKLMGGISKATTFVSEKSEDQVKQEDQPEEAENMQIAADSFIIPEGEEELLQHVSEYLKGANECARIGTLPSLLGSSVEKTFIDRMNARRSRRAHQYGIDMEKTNRFEEICAPFQALQPKPLASEELPKNLPSPSKPIKAPSNLEEISPLRTSTKVNFKAKAPKN